MSKRLSALVGKSRSEPSPELQLRNAIEESKHPGKLRGIVRTVSGSLRNSGGSSIGNRNSDGSAEGGNQGARNKRRSIHEEVSALSYDVVDVDSGKKLVMRIGVDGLRVSDAFDQSVVVDTYNFFQIKTFGVNAKTKLFELDYNEDATLASEDRVVTRRYESAKSQQLFKTVTSYVKVVVMGDEDNSAVVAQGVGGRLKATPFSAKDMQRRRQVKVIFTDVGVVVKKVSLDGTKLGHGETYAFTRIKTFTQNKPERLFKMTYDTTGTGQMTTLAYESDAFEEMYRTALAYARFVAKNLDSIKQRLAPSSGRRSHRAPRSKHLAVVSDMQHRHSSRRSRRNTSSKKHPKEQTQSLLCNEVSERSDELAVEDASDSE